MSFDWNGEATADRALNGVAADASVVVGRLFIV